MSKSDSIKKIFLEKNRGFSLIEVTMALLVLSIGLLGIALLQNRAMKDNYGSYMRVRAVQYAEDIMDRIRANRSNLDDYAIAVGVILGEPDADAPLAERDLWEWKERLRANLPLGDGAVEIVDQRMVVVRVEWREGIRDSGEVDDVIIGSDSALRGIQVVSQP